MPPDHPTYLPPIVLSALPHSANTAFPMLALLAGNPVCVMSERSAANIAPWIASFWPITSSANIPKGPTGNVSKRKLRVRYANGKTRPTASGRELREEAL